MLVMAMKANSEVNGVCVSFKPDFEDSSPDDVVASDFEITPVLPKESTHVSDRPKRKAKRFGKRALIDADSEAGSSREIKNRRRPRTRYGRGLPKKGGAGGKGTWGELGSELLFGGVDADVNDPNYDSESQGSCEFVSIVPELNEAELEKTLSPIFLEYFEHGDTDEVVISIKELNVGNNRSVIVVFAITLAMERKPSHREMTSVLLSDLYGQVLSEGDIQSGFNSLMGKLPDLLLDTPDAAVALGNFIARAVADDCLPPKYVSSQKGQVDCPHARSCLEHADTLLSMKHGLVRLDNVWGVGGGMRPVKYLVKQIQLIIKEYVCSGDIHEATRCLQELEVPHFHHEFVYEAVFMAIEDMSEKNMELMCRLLKSIGDSAVVSMDQLKNGFERVYAEMPDICIDVPHAYSVLKQFVILCDNHGFMPQELVRNVPIRGRKRFVSEGDGGLVKE